MPIAAANAAITAAGIAAAIATADIELTIARRPAPPAPMVEVVPHARPGHLRVSGYRAWHRDHHLWIRGRGHAYGRHRY